MASLATKFMTELVACWGVYLVSNSGVANDVLAHSKGKGMGFLAISIAFGASFAFGGAMTGNNAALNPAGLLMAVVIGKMNAGDFFTLLVAEILGGFLSGILLFAVYYAHFSVVPEKPIPSEIKVFGSQQTLSDIAQDGFVSVDENAEMHSKLNEADLHSEDADFKEAMKLYDISVTIDKATKLSCFATRPAIFFPLANFFAEFIATTILILGCQLLDDRYNAVGDATAPVLKGFLVGLIILGLGGPTGGSLNLGRDLGPRLAHAVLPIKGKGSSEFNYALITNAATLSAGAVAGCVYLIIQQWNN